MRIHDLSLVLSTLFLLSCAGTRGRHGVSGDLPRWPYAGVTRLAGTSIAPYSGLFFSGRCLEIDPSGSDVYAEAGLPGAITTVSLSSGAIRSIFDLGHGTIVENMIFHPDGKEIYILASTVRPENYGEVKLARALLKVDYELPLLLVPVSLEPAGYSHGLALLENDGLAFSMDTAGPDVSGGATLSRIDLIVDDLVLRRAVGNIPVGVRRRGLSTDNRRRRIYALLSENEAPSDFDPPAPRGAATAVSGVSLVAFNADSLTVADRLSLPEDRSWYAVAPTSRGVVVAGSHERGTSLIEIETQWMRQVAWLDIPDATNDLVTAGDVAVLPSRFGLYVIDLNLLSIRRFIPADVQRPTEAALSRDGRTACVMLDDVRWPGRPVLGIFNLDSGGLEKVVQ